MEKEIIVETKKEKRQNPVLFLLILIASVVVLAIFFNFITDGRYLTAMNIRVIFSNAVHPIFIAWAICFLFGCGYTDLSVGGVVILGSLSATAFGNMFGYPGVVLGGLIAGMALIFLNFSIFAFTKIPSWIAGISLAIFYEALALGLRLNRTIGAHVDTDLHRDFRALGQTPLNIILVAVGLVAVYIVYNRTTVGLNIRALGGNKEVAKAMGVNVTRTLLFVGLICGVLIGIAAFIQQSFVTRTVVMTGLTSLQMIFNPLAIALLAQVLQKRINIVIAVPVCGIIIYAVFNLLTMLGVPSGTLQPAVLGVFLIIFGISAQRGVKEVVK